MNWIDFIIIGAMTLALVSGFQRGAVLQAFSWGGLLLGLIVGAALAPHIVGFLEPSSDLGRIGFGLGVFLGISFLVEGILATVGIRVRRKITNVGARHADAAVGALIGVVFSLAASWFLGFQLRQGPSRQLARAIEQSKILQAADSLAPRPPGFLAAIGRFFDRSGFPDVFAQLNPGLAAPGVQPPPPGLARDPDILAAGELTYKIESRGCGGVVDGSGFPLDSGTVITAAHVVAGTRDHMVIEADGGRHRAAVVYMDTGKDIAVLRVENLGNRALTLLADRVASRTDGAAIGYPGGGPRTTSVARVRTETDAVGRDIYSKKLIGRRVIVLSANPPVRPGNSGGPFVDTEGRVRGMVFAASASRADESYALAGTEVSRAYQAGRARSGQVNTGECAL